MKIEEILANRVRSSFNISIGTGIALEALFTPTADRYDDTLEIEKYDGEYKVVYLSLYTIVRNILQSISTPDRKLVYRDLDAKALSEVTLSEYEAIAAIADTQGKEVMLFDYTPIVETKKKKVENKMTINEYNRILSQSVSKRLKVPRLHKHVKGVMLTSLGLDLLKNNGVWLRSHTGEVVTRNEFNRVYHKLKTIDTSILPFNETLLKVFGDNSGLIEVPKPVDRRRIYNYLVEKKVTPYRSEAWCKMRLKKYEKEMK